MKKYLPKSVPPFVIVAALTSLLLGYLLFSLVPYSQVEEPHSLGSATLGEIKGEALFAPVKTLQFGILKITESDVYIRAASAIIALAAAIFLYLMLKKWHTTRVALITSLMFATSSLFLHQGRLASTEVMYLAVWPALLLGCLWFLSKNNTKTLPIAAVLAGLALYVPGTWLFLLGGLVFFRKFTWRKIKKLPWKLKLLYASLFLATLAPLIYSFTFRQRQIIEWLGFNADQTFTLKAIAGNLAGIPDELFFTGISDPAKWLGGTPIFDVFAIAMMILGIYAYRAGYYPARQKLLFGAIILSILLIWIGQVATIVLIVPLLYILVANGLAYMLQSWFTVFPRNPVARSIGIGILCVVVAISCFFQLQRYFVAWPAAEPTKSALTPID